MVMGLVKVSADCVMVISTGLTPSAVKRTMPRAFLRAVSLEGDAHREVALAAVVVYVEPFAPRFGDPFGVRRYEYSSDPAELDTIFSLKLSRTYGFPVLPLSESSLLQWLQHSIIMSGQKGGQKGKNLFHIHFVLGVSPL